MTRCMLGPARRHLVGALVLASALSLLGCPPTGSLPREEVRRKLLQYQGVKFHQRQFFVGIAHGANLEAATQTAYQEITRQLTWLPAGSQDLLRGMYRVDRSATEVVGLHGKLRDEPAGAKTARPYHGTSGDPFPLAQQDSRRIDGAYDATDT